MLGGGGFAGQAFHLGVLTALAEVAGFDARRADVVVGTSAGSLVAAGLTGGLSAADLQAELLGEPLSAEGRRVRGTARVTTTMPEPEAARRRPLAPQALLAAARRPWAVRPGSLAGSLLPAGRTSTTMIARGLQRLHGPDWPTGLRVCTVRARDTRRVVFGAPGAPAADVGTACAASCAIPAYFAPVSIGGDAYVDGGMHSPTNADVVLAERPDLVVVSSPMTYARGATRARADLGLRLAVRRYLAQEVRALKRSGADVVVFQPGPEDLTAMGLNPMLHARVEQTLDAAAASTRARLQAQPDLVARLG